MNNKNKNNIKKLVFSGLFASFVFITIVVIPPIPTPTNGYINFGDSFVNISAWLLGPIYGAAAAGIGSAFADLFLGYTLYAPVTFLIKALMALASFFIFKAFSKHSHGLFARIISASVAEIIMVLGYFAFECILYGFAGSIIGVPANIIQGVGGVVIAVVLHEAIFCHIPFFKNHNKL